jgi:hypothetical protein
VNEGDASAGVQAPIPVVAASALLWIQGAIWATLGTLVVLYYPEKMTAGDLLIAVFFGFTTLSGTLAVLLPRPGSERARAVVIALECFMTFLGLAVTAAVLLDPFTAWIAVFALAGPFVAACAVGGLLTAPARDYCRPRAVPR